MKQVMIIIGLVVFCGLVAGCAIEAGGGDNPDAGPDDAGLDGSGGEDAGADTGAGCTDVCTPGVRVCDGDAVLVCGDFDQDPCAEWSGPQACAANEHCREGQCEAFCEDACEEGALHCQDDGFQVCGQHDDDPCLEWGETTACEPGYNCDEGRCVIGCEDACEAGARRCAEDGTQTCDDHDEDPCLEWSETNPCPEQHVCVDASCVCDHACEEGARRCDGDGYETCGDYDQDPCREWGDPVPCPARHICSDGTCVCDHLCPEGAVRCAPDGAEAIEHCLDLDGDGCREWGDQQPCDPDLVCDPMLLSCVIPYPEGPYGTQLGDTMENLCLEEAVCPVSGPTSRRLCLRSFLGKKAILISVHAGWCPTCHQQMLGMEALYQTYKDDGLAIILVQIEDDHYDTGRDALLAYCCWEKETYGLTFSSAIDPAAGKTGKYFSQGYIPLNLVLDDDMAIRYKLEGYDPDTLVPTIQQLLAE